MTEAGGGLPERSLPAGRGDRGRRGRDELLERDVAVKEILFPPGLEVAQRRELTQRAMREARSAARLNHPGIVTVHDMISRDEAPMIIMEFVRGCSLAQAIAENGRMPPERVAAIGMDMVEALAEAHQAGIVHRDLKPVDILPAGRRPVITDFGDRESRRRRHLVARLGPEPVVEGHESRVVASVAAERMQPHLAKALAALSGGERDVLLLVALGQLGYDGVAQALGIAIGTVGSGRSRARTKIPTLIDPWATSTDAHPLVTQGVLDQRLFDVTQLLRWRYRTRAFSLRSIY
nr:protein kinase [Streptosporangium amethystogenes]